ncbi:MAG: SRPBCC family protein [Parvularculaceae bacterium]|jgi:hypothetical protein|nr:SRPBCC family protein [Parvularculaceae bacterium]
MDQVGASAAIEIDAPAAAVFALAAGSRISDFVRPFGPLPGVARVEGPADWRAPGETRLITLTDGSSLEEELTGLDPGRRFSYRATRFSGPFGALVAQGLGEWSLTAEGTGRTRLVWSYAFAAKNALALPLLALLVRSLWPAYMQAALRRLKAEAERARAASA